MLVRIVKEGGPGFVYKPGSLLRLGDKQAQHLVRLGIAVPDGCPYEIKRPGDIKPEHFPLVGENATSIIIPVYNQAGYLRQCLDAVGAYTDGPYEIIIIDNGSDAETKAVIKNAKARVITNTTNLGFPKAVNQGILNAKGNRFCLLNSDCVVTPGWLSEMVKALDGEVGLVGPATNYSSGKQCIRGIHGTDFRKIQTGNAKDWELPKILETADRFSNSRETYSEVTDLSGFCLLIDRRVVSEIGAFDWHTFGLGSAEEKDYEDRATRRGWKLVWAKGSYVHHHGHKTLRGVYNANDGLGVKGKQNHQLYLQRIRERDNNTRGVAVPFFDGIPVMYPTWGRLGYTQKTLPRLIEKSPRAEIVILDDGSLDGTVAWLENFDNPQIAGKIYRARRYGLDKQIDLFFSLTAGVEWVGKMDNDVIVPDRWMEDLLAAADNAEVDVIAPSHFKNVMAKRKYLAPNKEIEGTGVYRNMHVGGLFLLRRSWLETRLGNGSTSYWSNYGVTPGGWTHLQETAEGLKAFYPNVYVPLLDLGEGKNDYPEYNAKLTKERRIAYGRIPEEQ